MEAMTLQEANAKVDAEIEAALEKLPRPVRTKVQLSFDDTPCDETKEWPKSAKRSIEVTGMPEADIPKYWNVVKSWWLSRGYEIWHDEDDLLQVVHPDTEISLGLEAPPSKNRMYILADSPCVGPDGTNYGL